MCLSKIILIRDKSKYIPKTREFKQIIFNILLESIGTYWYLHFDIIKLSFI